MQRAIAFKVKNYGFIKYRNKLGKCETSVKLTLQHQYGIINKIISEQLDAA